MRLAVWWVEWRLATVRPRRFLVGAIVPLALVLPVATGALGQGHAAAAYVLIFAACAIAGSAVPLRWEAERGMTVRIVAGGVAPWSYLLQRTAARATIDVVQITPALAVVVAAARASPAQGVATLVVLALSVWVGGLAGVFLAAWGRSLVETGVFAALATVLLAHASGVFRSSPPGSLGAFVEGIAPFRALHESLLEIANGAPAGGEGALVAWAAALAAVVALAAPAVHKALTRSELGRLGSSA